MFPFFLFRAFPLLFGCRDLFLFPNFAALLSAYTFGIIEACSRSFSLNKTTPPLLDVGRPLRTTPSFRVDAPSSPHSILIPLEHAQGDAPPRRKSFFLAYGPVFLPSVSPERREPSPSVFLFSFPILSKL